MSQLHSRLSPNVKLHQVEHKLNTGSCTYVTNDVRYSVSGIDFPSFTEHAQSHVDVS